MIKVIYGEKGTGKTKIMRDTANRLATSSLGEIVFIDGSNQLMYDLKHEIRFVNISEFPVVTDISGFVGFICGIISENYDIHSILIDRVNFILKEDIISLKSLFDSLKQISSKFNTDFYISISGHPESIPEYMQEFID